MASPFPDSGTPTEASPFMREEKRLRLLEGGAFFLFLVFLSSLAPSRIQGQEWNDGRVLEMVREARDLRHRASQDPEFRSYSSQARGYVHFFLHREDTDERILVKTDQIALEVYWQAPDRFRQRIVGLRDEKSLPTDIRYHLDHLVVVQDEFGDLIRIGDGDEVEAVLHPAAPGSENFYDFLLADSITLSLPGPLQEVRVYEVQVRPRNPDTPAFLGSIFLDRDTRAIVRMSFTFTPASYEDPYLDHIRISLENGLWNGKYWLPYRQQLEIRREVPWLDIPAGSIIKGWFEVGDYQINPDLPPNLFLGPTITTLPEARRREFPFEEGLHEHLDTEGLRPPPEMEEIRSLALGLARDRYLSGLRKLRLHLPAPIISSAIRYNRAEGLYLGAGASYGLEPWLGTAGHLGFSFGRERPGLALSLHGGERRPETRISGFWNRPMDMGPAPAMSGVMNSLSTLLLEEDHQDLLFSTGLRLDHVWKPGEGSALDLEARWEDHVRPRNVLAGEGGDPSFRPVFPVEEGSWKSFRGTLTLSTPLPGMSLETGGLLGRFRGRDFGSLTGSLEFDRRWRSRGLDLKGHLSGGALLGTPPRQALYLFGGRGTVPGYPFRWRVGDRFWLLRAEATYQLLSPFLSLRALGAAGGTDFHGTPLPDPWGTASERSTMSALGLGVALGWDVVRLDLARGLGEGGEWSWIFSVNPAFRPWL